MSRSRIAFFVVSFVITVPMLAGTLLRAADRGQPSDDDSLYKYLSVFTEVLGLVRQTYVDQPNMDVLMAGALDGTTDALDPFSLYVPASQVQGYTEARNVGWLHSGVILLKEHGVTYVVAVDKGGPAGQAGFKPGDIVAKISDQSTRQMPLWEMQEVLAGKPGTKISMELIRLGEPVQASFVLAPFTPPPPSLDEVQGAALLRIPTFDAQTAEQVEKLLAANTEKTRHGLLIDLRGVSSGDPEAAYATAKLFANGDLGILKRRAEEVKTFAATAKPAWQGRVVVLVDRGTLGASEVLATVLRQKIKADLVGERTFGYAGHQGWAELSTGGRLLFTESFYTGPDKKPIREALKPDLLVDERVRTYLEKDVPMSELILRRAVQRLLGGGEEEERKVA
ncbi:MAG TPA: S41 family peptidase [Thermoanaerobaculia bacterium]|jgi:carboxyl-terminal processing protease|nr:S41 family peptidase [Thermoanaerobaculia bacterium]